jgi:F-type H+-transporting ATPase subunit b
MSTLLLTFPTADAPALLTALPAPQDAAEHAADDLAATDAHTTTLPYEKPVPSLLQVKPGLLIFTIIVFVIVALLLAKYAWGPISKALEDRERNIEDSLSQAERALAEAKAIQADNEKARRQAEAQATQILRDAREAAERTGADLRAQADQRISDRLAQAEADIERQKQAALGELRAEVAGLAITAAEKILRQKLDETEQRRLVDQFIDTLPRN